MATLKVTFSASHTLQPSGEFTGPSLLNLTIDGIDVVTGAEITSEDAENPNIFTYEVEGLDLSGCFPGGENTAIFTLTNPIEEGREVNIGYIRYNTKYDDGYYKGFYYSGNAPADAVEKPRPESRYYTTTADERANGAPDVMTTWYLVPCGDGDYGEVNISDSNLYDSRTWTLYSDQFFIRVASPATWGI